MSEHERLLDVRKWLRFSIEIGRAAVSPAVCCGRRSARATCSMTDPEWLHDVGRLGAALPSHGSVTQAAGSSAAGRGGRTTTGCPELACLARRRRPNSAKSKFAARNSASRTARTSTITESSGSVGPAGWECSEVRDTSHLPMSSSGVQITGGAHPAMRHAISIAGRSSALAICRRFHVKR